MWLLCWLRCVPNPFRSVLPCGRAGFPFALMLTAFECLFKQVSNSLRVMADSSFSAYNSVLSHYPSLCGGSLGLQEMAGMPNVEGLRVLAAARRMTDNGLENARICQFEVPGGGECRDAACGDIHLSLLGMEPQGAPCPITLCLFRHAIILSTLAWLWSFVYRRRDCAIPMRGSERWANGSSAPSGAYSAARGDL